MPPLSTSSSPTTLQYAKQEYVTAAISGPARYESFALSDLKMVGQNSFRVRTLQVYTNNNGQWQMSAHQSARMRSAVC